MGGPGKEKQSDIDALAVLGLKRCSCCGEAKLFDEFSLRRRRGRVEHQSKCKDCERKYRRSRAEHDAAVKKIYNSRPEVKERSYLQYKKRKETGVTHPHLRPDRIRLDALEGEELLQEIISGRYPVSYPSKPDRYPSLTWRGCKRDVHVFVWELINGPVPKGSLVHHVNENKSDFHPSNLELKTFSQHAKDHNPQGAWGRLTEEQRKALVAQSVEREKAKAKKLPPFNDLLGLVLYQGLEEVGKQFELTVGAVAHRLKVMAKEAGIEDFSLQKMRDDTGVRVKGHLPRAVVDGKKVCSRCNELLSVEMFQKKSSGCGYIGQCKECNKKSARESYRKRMDKLSELPREPKTKITICSVCWKSFEQPSTKRSKVCSDECRKIAEYSARYARKPEKKCTVCSTGFKPEPGSKDRICSDECRSISRKMSTDKYRMRRGQHNEQDMADAVQDEQ